jgi:two-component system KDP operon response regulator KdpE
VKSILIIDDDDKFRSILALELGFNNYVTYEAIDGRDGMLKLRNLRPDLLLLDLGLPDIDGKILINEIRRIYNELRIIIITARTADQEESDLLNSEADDYLKKPFTTKSLLARIENVFRHQRYKNNEHCFIHGDFSINYRTRIVLINNEHIELTAIEYKILELLTLNPGIVHSYEKIAKYIGNLDSLCYKDSIKVIVNRIRKKIENDTIFPKYILSRYNQGYYFQAENNE